MRVKTNAYSVPAPVGTCVEAKLCTRSSRAPTGANPRTSPAALIILEEMMRGLACPCRLNDANSRGKVQNVHGDSSATLLGHDVGAALAPPDLRTLACPRAALQLEVLALGTSCRCCSAPGECDSRRPTGGSGWCFSRIWSGGSTARFGSSQASSISTRNAAGRATLTTSRQRQDVLWQHTRF